MLRPSNLRVAALPVLMGLGTAPALAQEDSAAVAESVSHAPRGSQFLVPGLSFLLPGAGQYFQNAWWDGAAFSASAAAGMVLYLTGDTAGAFNDELPRDWDAQRSFLGAQLYQTAGSLSAYDSFRRSLPALQREGKYAFFSDHEAVGALLTAPFDVQFLRRWTTWVDLGITGAITTLVVLTETAPGKRYEPFRAHDAMFGSAVSLQAGIGEEALFRGWFYPVLHQATGQRFWLSNSIQAAVFGGLHVPQARAFATVITGWAFYEGWLTRRNGWSIRESIFHHFWYDAIVVAALFLTQERRPDAVVSVGPLPFRTPAW